MDILKSYAEEIEKLRSTISLREDEINTLTDELSKLKSKLERKFVPRDKRLKKIKWFSSLEEEQNSVFRDFLMSYKTPHKRLSNVGFCRYDLNHLRNCRLVPVYLVIYHISKKKCFHNAKDIIPTVIQNHIPMYITKALPEHCEACGIFDYPIHDYLLIN